MSGRRLSVRDYKGSRRAGLALDRAWLLPFVLGVALGLAIAAGVFVAAHRHVAAEVSVTASADAAPSANARDRKHADGGAHDPPAATQTASPGSAAGSSTVADNARPPAPLPTGLPKYDFYQMLPRSQVLIPERESEARLPAGATVERPGVYFLQIGSYKDAAMADRVRAQAQKLGVSASVQRIVVDAATWHRVRVGPIHDLALLNHVRHQLQAGNLAAMVVRVNP